MCSENMCSIVSVSPSEYFHGDARSRPEWRASVGKILFCGNWNTFWQPHRFDCLQENVLVTYFLSVCFNGFAMLAKSMEGRKNNSCDERNVEVVVMTAMFGHKLRHLLTIGHHWKPLLVHCRIKCFYNSIYLSPVPRCQFSSTDFLVLFFHLALCHLFGLVFHPQDAILSSWLSTFRLD